MHKLAPPALLPLAVLSVMLVTTDLSAQISFGGRPWAEHGEKLGLPEPPVYFQPVLDRDVLLAEDEQRAATGSKRLRFGVNHATDLDLANSGIWSTLPNGDRVWRLDVWLEGATSVNFEFHDFVVPEGAMVYAYTPSGERLGGFTAESNPGSTELGVGLLPGDRITIEYDEPAAVAGQGRLRIGQVTQGYRDSFNMMKGFGASLACNNNVICPEGDPWRPQIRSVARIVVGGSDWCTGSLINNCANDGTPYFLTANHCISGNVGTWVFAFNWESSSCPTNVNTPMNETVSGATLLTTNAGSDMALLELNTAPPADYEVYYSGWDATGDAPLDQIGIHHPAGDQKKISFNGETSVEVAWGGASTWEVNAWDDGTTEGGSSGSGLWDQNGRIVGQLYGGTFGCNCTDNYGRFSVSYPFIDDIIGTCGPILDGYDPNQTELAVDGAVQSITGIPDVVCNASLISPVITIRNAGLDALTSLLLDWQIDGGASGQATWNGNLASGATATITIADIPVINGSQTLTVTGSMPNGIDDPNSVNDIRVRTFTVADPGVEVELSIILDEYGSETTWQVSPAGGGNALYSGGPYADDSSGQEETTLMCLPAGCFTLTMLDSYGDGICCDYGEGSYALTMPGSTLVTGNGQFTDSITHDFCVSFTGIDPHGAGAFGLRPNPTNGGVEVLWPGDLANGVIEMFDATGRQVWEGNINAGAAPVVLDLSGQPEGVYLVKVTTTGQVFTERLVLQY